MVKTSGVIVTLQIHTRSHWHTKTCKLSNVRMQDNTSAPPSPSLTADNGKWETGRNGVCEILTELSLLYQVNMHNVIHIHGLACIKQY